ncbi:tripartite tricarboxylate transporter substrate binding protein [Variovorax sp. J22G73]|uniref:Bug family tripartite tricarboxylate transporter substrate binding protein n=1 Tax=unclassified Variovorax TaxID=663243 RepID=UPI00257694B7|nr:MULTISPECIES: tripartite tricarboxylate transporter substrate binding protein [unclassified Variovorax]MDM0010613.1 tripartite tricarboxylate transporter substrate binding protein [Variovorax sp. J22R203]MDM0103059.1 tripartite tricarboxylate transporter substrate binding protein [Variovorax sp. J22G73]
MKNFIPRIRWRTAIASVVCTLACGVNTAAHAEKFPDKPITLYVGFAAGGSADSIARALADEMSKSLGQRVIIDNRSGASGNIATQLVLGKEADGYSLLFAAIHLATNPALAGVKYDPAKDLTMVSQITSVPVVMLASNASGIKSPDEVDAAAKRASGGLRVGSGGVGTSSHLAMELYKRARGTSMIHVPYRGGAPANQDLMGGQIDMMFDLMSGSLKGTVDAEKIRPLAVMQKDRIPGLPNVKSAGELGLPTSTFIRSWQGIAVRAGTPAPIVARLHQAVVAAASSETFKHRAEQLGSEVVTSKTPKDFETLYAAELTRWSALIKAADIKAE